MIKRADFGRGFVVAISACTLAVTACSGAANATGGQTTADDTIKVGVLHSLSGTMSISEVSVKDAALLAIAEINASGGVLGKKLSAVVQDGASDWPTFAEKAQKLISTDKVVATFGGWTTPLGATQYETIVNKLKAAKPDSVFNTFNGDSNVAFSPPLRGRDSAQYQ